jgi:hypothetical protein
MGDTGFTTRHATVEHAGMADLFPLPRIKEYDHGISLNRVENGPKPGGAYALSAAIICVTFGVPSSWKRCTCICSILSALVTRSCGADARTYCRAKHSDEA